MSDWLIGVTAAAMLAAVARCLMPPGAVQQVGSLICAMMLLWAVLKPLTPLAEPLADRFDLDRQIRTMDSEWKQQSGELFKSLIEQECEAYIVDKAAGMGIDCYVRVACCAGEGGVWMPDSIRVVGELTEQQCRELGQVISKDLGVEPDRQEFAGGG